MSPINTLAAEWLDAKTVERNAIEHRRRVEDEICRLATIEPADEGTRTISAGELVVKIVCRVTKKIDSALAQEIAAENDLTDYLTELFRWKPELNMSAWESSGDNVKSVFSKAITTTPNRPSFTITQEK